MKPKKTNYPAIEHAKECFRRSGWAWPAPEEVAAHVAAVKAARRRIRFARAVGRATRSVQSCNLALERLGLSFATAGDAMATLGASIKPMRDVRPGIRLSCQYGMPTMRRPNKRLFDA